MNAWKGNRPRNNLSLVRGSTVTRPAAFSARPLRITRHEPSPWPALLRSVVVVLAQAFGFLCAVLLTSGYLVYLSGHLAVVITP